MTSVDVGCFDVRRSAGLGNMWTKKGNYMNLNIFKQMAKVKEKMAQAQEAVREKTVEATVGGGMVTVVANGAQEVISIKVDKQVIDPDDVDMLEDLVLSAVNDALRKSKELMAREMGRFARQMGLPPQILSQM